MNVGEMNQVFEMDDPVYNYGIVVPQVRVGNIPDTQPFRVSLLISTENRYQIKSALEISGGGAQTPGNAIRLFPVETDAEISHTFHQTLYMSTVDTTGILDLRFLHKVMQYPSEEERAREVFVFTDDHAKNLRRAYASWVAQVLAKNFRLAAKINVYLPPVREPGVVLLLNMWYGTNWHPCGITYGASLRSSQEQESLRTILGLHPAPA